MMHSMGRKKGNNKFMAIKIDLEKVYDHLNWNFINHRLMSLNLGEDFVNLIISRIKTSSFKVLWNGEKTESFLPSTSIRQGNPLFPNIFVIVWIICPTSLWTQSMRVHMESNESWEKWSKYNSVLNFYGWSSLIFWS